MNEITCPQCKATNPTGTSICGKCGAYMLYQKPLSQSSPTYDRSDDTGYHFRVLLSYGKIMSGLGWFVIIIGVILLFIGLSQIKTFGVLGVIGGIIIGVMGFIQVASGQVISCFVSIEKNTRATYDILKPTK